MRAAHWLGVAPWDLAVRADREYWQAWALTAEAAEADAQQMAGDLDWEG